MELQNYILMSGANSVQTGTAADSSQYALHTFTVSGTGITTGATVRVEGIDCLGNIVLINSFTMTSANPVQGFTIQAVYPQIRARISAYTDGTYAVTYAAASY
jgi:hypothetical protein